MKSTTVLTLFVVVLASSQATAQDGALSTWHEPVIELTLAGPNVVAHRAVLGALESSAETWAEVDHAPLIGVYSDRGEVAEVAYDGVNAVFFEEDWPGLPSQLALTFTHISDGRILEMDMAINAEHHAFTTRPDTDFDAFDLQNLLTHELGHGLGLEHIEHDTASMYRRIDPGEIIKRDLDQPDVELLSSLYEGVGAQSGGCAATGAPPLFAGILLLFLSAIRFRPTRADGLR